MSKRNGSQGSAKGDVLTHKEDPILSPNQVAKMINKAPGTVLGWIRDGLMDAIKYPGEPGRFGVRESVVMNLLSNSALADRVNQNGNY